MACSSASRQRTCEVLFFEGAAEVDLHRHMVMCTKNPGHQNFIPADKFTLDNLPQGYKERKLFELIKCKAELTVRLTTKLLNTESTPGASSSINNQIPASTDSCTRNQKFGTGYVNCIAPGEIRIQTSAHIFDNSFPVHADVTSDFFFDSGSTPGGCPGVVTLTNLKIIDFNSRYDTCEIITSGENPDLIRRLQKANNRYSSLEEDICRQYRIPTQSNLRKPLIVIVSHPHGCSKQITIGYCTSRDFIDFPSTKLTYNTPTCPGSSGADVYLLGFTRRFQQHVHAEGGDNCNYSNDGPDVCDYIPTFNFLNLASQNRSLDSREHHGQVMTFLNKIIRKAGRRYTKFAYREETYEEETDEEESYGDEAKVEQNYGVCNLRLDHHVFVSVREFKEKQPFIHKSISTFIRLNSDLTVRVKVEPVNHRGQGELADSDGHELRSSDSSSNLMITATGFIARVNKNNDETKSCMCNKCRETTSRETEFAQIYVLTASKVVSNKSEGEKSSCDLFFDSGYTLDDCSDAVSLSGAQRVDGETEELCNLIYYTHDLDLADRLQEILNKREDFKRPFKKMIAFSNLLLAAVVFHPYGCGKHISLGYSRYPCNYKVLSNSFSPMLCEALTCPGSAGSKVLFLINYTWFDY